MLINGLPVASTITDDDKLDMWQNSSGTDVGIPMALLRQYIDTTSCGRCRGSWVTAENSPHTDNDLDKATGADIGVWKWTGSANEAPEGFPYTYALVEITRHEIQSGTDSTYDLVQRLNVGDAIYQRMKTSTMESWSPLRRFDVEYQMEYADVHHLPTTGSDGKLSITFSQVFNVAPIVLITPLNDSPDWEFYGHVYDITTSGFKVKTTAQRIPDSETPPPSWTIDFGNSTADLSGITDYIERYCIVQPEAVTFNWVAIAPKTVSSS